MSNSEIEGDVRRGWADFALLGSDKYGEIEDRRRLAFEPVGKLACQFALAAPVGRRFNMTEPNRVATSYTLALQQFAQENALNVDEVVRRSGKVEGACKQGIADAVFDIVETGASLRANGLEVVREGDYLELGGFWIDKTNV